jgi:hypothetical protein
MNCKAKGASNECKTKAFPSALGYTCLKSGGSLGIFHVVPIGTDDILLVQVIHRWVDGRPAVVGAKVKARLSPCD